MSIDTNVRENLSAAYTGVTLADPVEGVMRRGTRIRRARRARMAGPALVGAAAIALGVVVLPSDDAPYTPGPITLVSYEAPSFPLSFENRPELVASALSLDPPIDNEGQGVAHASFDYVADTATGPDDGPAAGPDDGVSIEVSPDEPENVGRKVSQFREFDVDGADATLYELLAAEGYTGPPTLGLVWERQDDQWVTLAASGPLGDRDEIVRLAQDVTDRPMTVPLQIGVAPAGWEVIAYKDDVILTLADPRAEELHADTLTVHLPGEAVPADELVHELMDVTGPMEDVVVNGQPAQLVPTGYGWYLQALLPDGGTFVLMAPTGLDRQQTLEVAATVTRR